MGIQFWADHQRDNESLEIVIDDGNEGEDWHFVDDSCVKYRHHESAIEEFISVSPQVFDRMMRLQQIRILAEIVDALNRLADR